MGKFAVGEASGGEFFDIAKGSSSLVFLLTATKSYLYSSMIPSSFENLKGQRGQRAQDKKTMESFLDELTNKFSSPTLRERESLKSTELLLFSLDLLSLKFRAYRFGSSEIVSNISGVSLGNSYPLHSDYYERAQSKGKLKRGERWAIISPGLICNFAGVTQGDSVSSKMAEEMKEGTTSQKLMDEVFLQVKGKKKGPFLKNDASLVFLEVDPRAIIKV